jgi:hypothetical protein
VISPAQEADILARAYVPEHIVSLMALISGGDPFLLGDYLGFAGDNWLIFVGYPLDRDFSREKCELILKQAGETYRPGYVRFIGPETPSFIENPCTERESDRYYTLEIDPAGLKPSLRRITVKASALRVEREQTFSRQHEALVAEFIGRMTLPPRVRELYRTMPDYVGRSPTAWTLSARDKAGNLCAFYVVDLGAVHFATYLLGAHSKKYCVPHASDLLFQEMIDLSLEHGKDVINLGLGVNEGIRRFKEKWGGIPSLRYEFCGYRYGTAGKVSLIDALMARFLNGPEIPVRYS